MILVRSKEFKTNEREVIHEKSNNTNPNWYLRDEYDGSSA